jgi:uncharacterized glyoxalase superfamily protein PhnB
MRFARRSRNAEVRWRERLAPVTYGTNEPAPEMTNTSSASSADPGPLAAQSLQASLTVADVPRGVAWYRDVLGFTMDREYQRDGRLFATSLRAGAIRILLTQDDGAKGLDRAKGEGFSLQITTAQDIDMLAARAKQAGAHLDTEPADAFGARVFRLRDPDGFRWVISSPRTP